MIEKEIRWKQRLNNFEKAYRLFTEAVLVYPDLNVLEQEGLVKRFEYTFELAWKTLKDYLETEGFLIEKSPRGVIKRCIVAEYISNGQLWMEMLEARNSTSHEYDERILRELVHNIVNNFYDGIKQVFMFLEDKK